MKVTIGKAEFEATDLGLRVPPIELGTALSAVMPTVKQYWYCDKNTSKPAPPVTKITLPVNIGVHGATRPPPLGFSPDDPFQKAQYDLLTRIRRSDVDGHTQKVADRLSKITGYADMRALDAALQAPFGRKVDLPIPFDALIAPFKAAHSLELVTMSRYHQLVLTHPDLPDFEEMEVILAIPYGLWHTLRKTHVCKEGVAKKIKHWKWLPVLKSQDDRAKGRGKDEIAVRKWLQEQEKAQLKKWQKRLDEQKAEVDAEMERLDQEAEALGKD